MLLALFLTLFHHVTLVVLLVLVLAVLEQIASAKYAPLWEVVWGAPLAYSTPAEIDMNYDRVDFVHDNIGLAIRNSSITPPK